MSKRMEILKASLDKKETVLDQRFDNHFQDVKSANGQPLNDKRNGQATMNRWEKQNTSIRTQLASIEVTKDAIEREEAKQSGLSHTYNLMPEYLRERIDSGLLKQWGRHPHILFVVGVEKARIFWDCETNVCSHKFVKDIPNKEQYAIFRDVYNAINKLQSENKGQ